MESTLETLRVPLALLGLIGFGVLEIVRPFKLRSPLHKPLFNLAIWGVNAAIFYVLPVLSGVSFSLLAAEHELGLFNSISAPAVLIFFVSFAILDAQTYLIHRAYHVVPWMWWLHRFHHRDPHLSVSTGVRFHPGEVVLSSLIKGGIIVLFGIPVWCVLVFDALLLFFSQIQHANLALSRRTEKYLNSLIVTPRYHRVHHIAHRALTDSNYASILTIWDRIGRSQFPLTDGTIGLPSRSSDAHLRERADDGATA